MTNTTVGPSNTAGTPRKAAPSTRSRCEYKYKVREGEVCTRFVKFWVQRGQANKLVCSGHLAPTVEEMWSLASGWHGKSEIYEGYLLSDNDRVVVRMTDNGETWK